MTPAQQELNRLWSAQVYQPFSITLATKYPFAPGARIEATSNEIGRILGQSGSISQFVTAQLDPLVIRRGLQLTPKTWNDIGIHLNPKFVADFPQYIAPVGGSASTANLNSPGATNTNPDQTTFQIYPLPIAGLSEYVIDIDGQRLRYSNGQPEWVSFVWPNPSSQPGVKITATDLTGNMVTIVDEPGAYGLEKLMTSAIRKKLADGSFELRWNGQVNTAPLSVKFRLISGGADNNSETPAGSNGLKGLQLVPDVTQNTQNASQPTGSQQSQSPNQAPNTIPMAATSVKTGVKP
jgi:type VI secretion system protein ImpL